MADLAPLHPDAAAFTAYRVLPNGEGRTYTITDSTGGWRHLERFVRACRYTGKLTSARADSYAVLDVLDADDSIVQDYGVPTAQAWQWVKRKLRLAVDTGKETDRG